MGCDAQPFYIGELRESAVVAACGGCRAVPDAIFVGNLLRGACERARVRAHESQARAPLERIRPNGYVPFAAEENALQIGAARERLRPDARCAGRKVHPFQRVAIGECVGKHRVDRAHRAVIIGERSGKGFDGILRGQQANLAVLLVVDEALLGFGGQDHLGVRRPGGIEAALHVGRLIFGEADDGRNVPAGEAAVLEREVPFVEQHHRVDVRAALEAPALKGVRPLHEGGARTGAHHAQQLLVGENHAARAGVAHLGRIRGGHGDIVGAGELLVVLLDIADERIVCERDVAGLQLAQIDRGQIGGAGGCDGYLIELVEAAERDALHPRGHGKLLARKRHANVFAAVFAGQDAFFGRGVVRVAGVDVVVVPYLESALGLVIQNGRWQEHVVDRIGAGGRLRARLAAGDRLHPGGNRKRAAAVLVVDRHHGILDVDERLQRAHAARAAGMAEVLVQVIGLKEHAIARVELGKRCGFENVAPGGDRVAPRYRETVLRHSREQPGQISRAGVDEAARA